ncbi:hypothetical protein [Brucella anthropi]|uniref:Uncharacterized protein n=1 Tax=Brucella anthropi TaxID=529 RepID=A0A8I0TBF9_BRUAN|nr:hypothetical protein [Brucella anthropi]KAB2751818.1 hypothetical protein F9L05_01400 [Brucella anthropi]MBE0563684.1 hypothetical protein [Brucella anthropi]
MSQYKGIVHVWPYSTGRGQDVDQKEAGERVREIVVNAQHIGEALEKIELYREGIKTGPMVWEAPIISIEQI